MVTAAIEFEILIAITIINTAFVITIRQDFKVTNFTQVVIARAFIAVVIAKVDQLQIVDSFGFLEKA